jgi:cobalt-precorrin-6B (C15)-methyltransferase
MDGKNREEIHNEREYSYLTPFVALKQILMQFMKSDTTVTPPAGGPTKDEILAISLFKLRLTPTDIFADLGCGTGRVSIEASGRVKTVYATDKRVQACIWTKNQIEARGIENISVHHSENADFIRTLTHLDAAFIGGSQGIAEVIAALALLNVRSFVINAVMLETVYTAVTALRRHELFKEVISANICRSQSIGTGIMFKPIDPVFIICGGTDPC